MSTLTPSAAVQRVRSRNPIHPLTWEARYRGGGGIRQFDWDGQHWSREIDRSRVESLLLHGHDESPLTIPLPDGERPPDAVIIKAQVDISQTIDRDSGAQRWSRSVAIFAGWHVGDHAYLVEIDAVGRLWVHDGTLHWRWTGGDHPWR
jgi:hypothetical protein